MIFSIGQDSEGNVGVGVEGFRAIAEGVADGVNGENRFDHVADYSTTLMTFHPYTTTSIWFPKDPWVDMNGIQGSRNENPDNNLMVYARIACECNKTDPVRPTLFLEGSYEDERNDGGKLPPTTPRNVRMQAWYAFFAGAAGYSYGHCHNWDQYGNIDYLDSPGAAADGRVAAVSGRAGMVEARAGSDDPPERGRERREAEGGGPRRGRKRGLRLLPQQRWGLRSGSALWAQLPDFRPSGSIPATDARKASAC